MSKIQQTYGYAACLIALIVALISAVNGLNALLSLRDPIRAGEAGRLDGPSLSSFEAYQATQMRAPRDGIRQSGGPAVNASDTVSTAELRRRYEVMRADRIARGRFDMQQRVVVQGVLLLVAIALFAGHWRWLHRRRPPSEVPEDG